jgi:hypothetical protein
MNLMETFAIGGKMYMSKTKRRRLVSSLLVGMVLVLASWSMAGAAQLTVTCSTDPCTPLQLEPNTYNIGIGGYAVDQNGNITIALDDNALYSGVIAGTVNPMPPVPDVTVYLRKVGLANVADVFYTPDSDGKYDFRGLADGNYVVVVDAPGYQFVTPYHKVKIYGGAVIAVDNIQVGTGATVNFAYAPSPIAGVCGSSNGQTLTIAPTTNLCGTGSASAVSGTGPWSWSCAGSNGGTTASCSANKAGTPINGSCGSSNGQTLTTAPTTNLCGAGTASAVSGSGPWTWSCTGASGGTTASCSASKSGGGGGKDLGAPYPKTTFVSLAGGQLDQYYLTTTAASSIISIQMTTADWTGNLDLIASNVAPPTCQFDNRSSQGLDGLWYGPVTGSNESIGMRIYAPAGTTVYVTVCNRTSASASAKLFWTTY